MKRARSPSPSASESAASEQNEEKSESAEHDEAAAPAAAGTDDEDVEVLHVERPKASASSLPLSATMGNFTPIADGTPWRKKARRNDVTTDSAHNHIPSSAESIQNVSDVEMEAEGERKNAEGAGSGGSGGSGGAGASAGAVWRSKKPAVPVLQISSIAVTSPSRGRATVIGSVRSPPLSTAKTQVLDQSQKRSAVDIADASIAPARPDVGALMSAVLQLSEEERMEFLSAIGRAIAPQHAHFLYSCMNSEARKAIEEAATQTAQAFPQQV